MEDFYFPQYHLPLLLLSIQLRKHGCLLFFKFTLTSDVLLAQELSVSISKISASGEDICKENLKNPHVQKYYTSTVDLP